MCLTIEKIRTTFALVYDEKNPDGIKRSPCAFGILAVTGFLLLILAIPTSIVFSYFTIVAFGIFGTFISMSNSYDMYTGCRPGDRLCPKGWLETLQTKCGVGGDCGNKYDAIFCSLADKDHYLGTCFLVGLPVTAIVIALLCVIYSLIVLWIAYYKTGKRVNKEDNIEKPNDNDIIDLDDERESGL